MKQTTYAATLGAAGNWCIHSDQILVVNDVFAPSRREIKQALKMVDPYNESVAAGPGLAARG